MTGQTVLIPDRKRHHFAILFSILWLVRDKFLPSQRTGILALQCRYFFIFLVLIRSWRGVNVLDILVQFWFGNVFLRRIEIFKLFQKSLPPIAQILIIWAFYWGSLERPIRPFFKFFVEIFVNIFIRVLFTFSHILTNPQSDVFISFEVIYDRSLNPQFFLSIFLLMFGL